MIITMELPDDFHILNIGLVDGNDKHAVTRSFTKVELMEMDEYIERSEFTSFPADDIDDTLDFHSKCEKVADIDVTIPMEFGNKSNPIVDNVTNEVLKKGSSHKCGDWDEESGCCVNKLYDGYGKCPDDESCKLFWEKEK